MGNLRRTISGYASVGYARPRRHVPSHQYSPAVIKPDSGNIAVIGSAAQRGKKTKKFSVGGPESGPELSHAMKVSGTNTSAPAPIPVGRP